MRSPHTPDYSGGSVYTKQALEELRLNDPARYEQYIQQRTQADMQAAGIPVNVNVQIDHEGLRRTALAKLTPEEIAALGLGETTQPAQQPEPKKKRKHQGKSSYLGDMTSALKYGK